jgi:uncharacterized metal-binding protein YceD (DUF177 family)
MSARKTESSVPWSVPVAIGEIPEEGKRYQLAADADTRAQIAQLAGLRSLPRLQATFDVARQGADGVHVSGEVSASVGQDCVVTLEPVESEVKETVDLVFAPPRSSAVDTDGDEGDIDPGEPEPLTGNSIDLGALAVEFLILGIDPYPRKPDARFEAPQAKEDKTSHPFAALSGWKKKPGDQE